MKWPTEAAKLPPTPELARIAKLLEASHPQIVVVVGAGVAIGATGQAHASWLGLLKHGIRHLVQERFQPAWGARLEASLSEAFFPFRVDSALQHAGLVEQALRVPDDTAFAEWLEMAFTDFKCRPEVEASATLQALRDIEHAGALLLTTNYDSLLTDITGLAPVTWEEHGDFLRVITRQKSGILHIHGHWRSPSSIVLGSQSYERVVDDNDFQQLFKTLWLDWTWIYVGCGDGLDDPNLGRLLEWGKRWGASALPDFIFAKDTWVEAFASKPNKPENLFGVGYASHDELPALLHSVTPAVRCWPFVRVDGTFELFGVAGSNYPFPTRQEYLDGTVPTLAADSKLRDRLTTHGWASVLDVASVGKTTLALRIAMAHNQREHPVYYLDLKNEIPEDSDSGPVASLHRLARPRVLLILDNAHFKPELARYLWQQWNAKPAGSRGRLLIVGTRIHQVAIKPDQDLKYFESHSVNPAVLLGITPDDLGRVAGYLYGRIGRKQSSMPKPPASVLDLWHRSYRASLSAFTFATMNSLAEFQRGDWSLPVSRASEWVREHWLNHLDDKELQNAVCLAAFGAQGLEIMVQVEALPYPGQLTRLTRLGLLQQRTFGQFGRYRQFSLREPEWGDLILAALSSPVDIDTVLFTAAVRHPITTAMLAGRLRRRGLRSKHEGLWRAIARENTNLLKAVADVPLPWKAALLTEAKAANQENFMLLLWHAIESEPVKFAANVWGSPLDSAGSFLRVARAQGRDTRPLWHAIESEPDKFAANVWAFPLDSAGSFLRVARAQGRDTRPLWQAIESEPDKFAANVWAFPFDGASSFLRVARAQGRDTRPFWQAIESEPVKFAAASWKNSLDRVGSLLEVASEQGRDAGPLWQAIENEPDRLAASAWATSLDKLGPFLRVSKVQGRDIGPLCRALEREPDKFGDSVWASSLEGVGSFLRVAKSLGRDTGPLWQAIERHPDRLAASAWATPLEKLVAFLKVAKAQGRETELFWQAIESQPDKLAAHIWASAPEGIGSFLRMAKLQGHDTGSLWQAITSHRRNWPPA